MGFGGFTIPSIFTLIDEVSKPVVVMTKNVAEFASKVARHANAASEVAQKVAITTGIVGASILAPLALAANEAIKFEDTMADVGKTTGLSGADLERYGGSLLDLSGDTRTAIGDLVKISEIGGQLGIAKEDLLGFTGAVD
jgi:hypothetical protein